MPARRYSLVCDATAINMRQKLAREKMIRSVGLRCSGGDEINPGKYHYYCEVKKSPRAPEYVIHYVKTKKDGIQMIKRRKKRYQKLEGSVCSNQSVDGTAKSEDELKFYPEDLVREREDMVGLKVIACSKKDGLYYLGHVSHAAEAIYAIVTFDSGKKQKIRTQMIIPMGGAIPRPELAPGDTVLVQVFNESQNCECFVPGIVEFQPEDVRFHAKFYSVMLYNGQRETTLRKFIVKIGKARFEMAIRYITHIQQQRLLRQENQMSESSKQSDGASSDRSSLSSRGRRKKKKLTEKLNNKKDNSDKRKKSRSRSRSKSSRSSRSRSKSSQSSRSRTPSTSRSRSRSASKSSRSRSHSRSSEGSSTPRQRSPKQKYPYDRPVTPVPNPRPLTPPIRSDSVAIPKDGEGDEKDEKILELEYQLEKQKRKQFRQEQRLVRQARRINKIQRKLKETDISHDSYHTDRSDRTRSRHSSKGSPDGTSYAESPDTLSHLRSLLGLRCEQEVLARWSDDGWYYQGCVVADGKDGRYIIQDSTGYMETVNRDDILTDSEHKFSSIQPEDFVIGLHPKYVFSFAPAQVLGTFANHSVKVEFFDGNLAELTSEEVYKIPKAKYEQVLEYIKKCERNLIGKSVVARDDTTGMYKLGVVDSRVGLGQQYYIKWLDGDMTKQNANHMFEVGRHQTRHDDWTHILAPVSQRSMVFMPGEVIQSYPLVVQFCNGKRTTEATMDQCFWLSKDYYTNAQNFLLECQRQ